MAWLQGEINWKYVAGSGVAFAYIRAGESNWGEGDLKFQRNFDASREDGVVAGGYHVFHAAADPKLQARLLRLRLHDFKPGRDLPPCIDFEWIQGAGCTPQAIRTCEAMADAIGQAFGVAPMLYSSAGYLGDLVKPGSILAGLDLWCAHYGVGAPKVPAPWKRHTMWQWIGNGGHVAGVPTDCDRDVFNGSRAEFDAWLAGTAGHLGTADTDPAPATMPSPPLTSESIPRAESIDSGLTSSVQAAYTLKP